MTAETTTISGDTQAIIEAARLGGTPHILDPGRVYVVATANGDVKQFDLTTDEYRGQPKRKVGIVEVRDAASFLHYWAKHHNIAASEVYANLEQRTITAVLDAHTTIDAGWGRHILRLALVHHPAWAAWTRISGKFLDQQAFAEFIEEHRPNIINPSAADVLELAQTFQATSTADFKSGTILKNGQRTLQYVESTEASAGRHGQLQIPDALTLALPVFDADREAEEVTARFRYRVQNGHLFLAVVLDEVDDKVRSAFQAIVDEIGDQISVPVLRGKPAVSA